jgi:hypothetical protein
MNFEPPLVRFYCVGLRWARHVEENQTTSLLNFDHTSQFSKRGARIWFSRLLMQKHKMVVNTRCSCSKYLKLDLGIMLYGSSSSLTVRQSEESFPTILMSFSSTNDLLFSGHLQFVSGHEVLRKQSSFKILTKSFWYQLIKMLTPKHKHKYIEIGFDLVCWNIFISKNDTPYQSH